MPLPLKAFLNGEGQAFVDLLYCCGLIRSKKINSNPKIIKLGVSIRDIIPAFSCD